MFELLQKEFTIEILGKEVKYKQLSYFDCLELHYQVKNKIDLEEWAFGLLKDFDFKKEEIKKIDVTKLFQVYIDTACRDFYIKAKPGKGGDTAPFNSFLTFIAKEMGVDVLTMLKNYTPEAFNYCVDGIVYNLNEQTKEGQKKNKLKMIKKSNDMSDEEMKRKVLEMREKKAKNNLQSNN